MRVRETESVCMCMCVCVCVLLRLHNARVRLLYHLTLRVGECVRVCVCVRESVCVYVYVCPFATVQCARQSPLPSDIASVSGLVCERECVCMCVCVRVSSCNRTMRASVSSSV